MFDVFKNSMFARIAMVVCVVAAPCAAHAQATPAASVPTVVAIAKEAGSRVEDIAKKIQPGDMQFSLTYDVGDANLTSTTPFSFLMQGGSAEVEAQIYKGLGGVGSFTGVHSSNSGQGVPVNLFVAAFGPRYTVHKGHGKHSLQFYGQLLAGEADGFSGLYPMPGGAVTSANSLAIQTGGGVDVRFSRHLSIRVLQADWLRTYLPDSRQNIENTFRMGVGVVFHTAHE